MPAPIHALVENAGLAFPGEVAWMPAQLSEIEARRLLHATNACGRPNSDVLRRRLSVVDGEPAESWQIDFPEHFTMQEAALYEEPFALLCRHYAQVGISPHYNPDLRRALSRVSRWLAMPADAESPDWRWIEDDLLPDASLVAVAREDDYTHGVLQSAVFTLWHAAHRLLLAPAEVVESLPFPWPPGTALSSLSREQEEQRHAIARAARSGDLETLNAAVFDAYGWPADIHANNLLAKLMGLYQARQSQGGTS